MEPDRMEQVSIFAAFALAGLLANPTYQASNEATVATVAANMAVALDKQLRVIAQENQKK